jgi:hypothetical protein
MTWTYEALVGLFTSSGFPQHDLPERWEVMLYVAVGSWLLGVVSVVGVWAFWGGKK